MLCHHVLATAAQCWTPLLRKLVHVQNFMILSLNSKQDTLETLKSVRK
jgi:hypothetical protein